MVIKKDGTKPEGDGIKWAAILYISINNRTTYNRHIYIKIYLVLIIINEH